MSTAPAENQISSFDDGLAPAAQAGFIHVWRLQTHPAPEGLSTLRSLLSPDEIARADRFHFSEHRNAFIVNRANLRLLLSHYLAQPADAILFTYGAQGKPEVIDADIHGLHFNLSHTEGLALVAIAHDRRVGIDVESIRPSTDYLEIARRHFSPAEYQQLSTIEAKEQLTAFYRCWTRKEALLKGLGEGLQRSLNEFQVNFLTNEPATVIALAAEPVLYRNWYLHPVDAGPGYIAALAHDGAPLTQPIQTCTLNKSIGRETR
jgi:4'-phosphopantetheinyl transferase